MTETKPPVVLCFSGLDPSGGAGILADIEAISSQGALCAPIITAATVQDTQDVISFAPMPADLIIEQARAVLEDMPISVIKIGMVGSTEIAEAIHSILMDYPSIKVVYDPVFSTEKDGALSTPDLVDSARSLLLPLTTILTPNIFEVHALAPGSDTPTAAAVALLETSCQYVLLTGTHGKTTDVVHTLFSNHRELTRYSYQRLPHKYHGSGCTLASSLAAMMTIEPEIENAVRQALDYTHKTLIHGKRIGMGQYHPDRFFWTKQKTCE
ncbi:MAG: hydroxymethylpyrimidine/phosphomethylpyrimidine kinase [Gammaproteobacteria bacterium]|nr:hydroxymethylpyrimidine/phosphomethylpyrimidine kinase [Gammaproteobacteria bacterium]NNJ97226.1 hydroxymethylpyrimidine/phosphomethylpyrimidine kinase [Gammaproteobacteria bacterium]